MSLLQNNRFNVRVTLMQFFLVVFIFSSTNLSAKKEPARSAGGEPKKEEDPINSEA